jgi:hypothetical protein
VPYQFLLSLVPHALTQRKYTTKLTVESSGTPLASLGWFEPAAQPCNTLDLFCVQQMLALGPKASLRIQSRANAMQQISIEYNVNSTPHVDDNARLHALFVLTAASPVPQLN